MFGETELRVNSAPYNRSAQPNRYHHRSTSLPSLSPDPRYENCSNTMMCMQLKQCFKTSPPPIVEGHSTCTSNRQHHRSTFTTLYHLNQDMKTIMAHDVHLIAITCLYKNVKTEMKKAK